jgi:hypothetical protein
MASRSGGQSMTNDQAPMTNEATMTNNQALLP